PYVRATGAPVTVTSTFAVSDTTITYTLRIQNGGNGQFPKVTSATVSLNGQQVLAPSDFGQDRTLILLAISLAASNRLDVELRGQPGSGFVLDIFGTPADPTPPVITAEASPPPNAQGWNNTDVTITFTCSDADSGIASCPGPRTVTAEGAHQVVTGVATDLAGNSASVEVVVNIDRTPPTVTVATSPPPNAQGWNNSNVAVSFTCADALSGVVTCPGNTTVFSEGAGQPLVGTAMDRAGNTSSVGGSLDRKSVV